MRQRGLEHARLYSRAAWRDGMAELVEEILDGPRPPRREHVEIVPRTDSLTVSAGQETLLVPVRVVNRGTHAVAAEGPGRSLVESRVSWQGEAEKAEDRGSKMEDRGSRVED